MHLDKRVKAERLTGARKRAVLSEATNYRPVGPPPAEPVHGATTTEAQKREAAAVHERAARVARYWREGLIGDPDDEDEPGELAEDWSTCTLPDAAAGDVPDERKRLRLDLSPPALAARRAANPKGVDVGAESKVGGKPCGCFKCCLRVALEAQRKYLATVVIDPRALTGWASACVARPRQTSRLRLADAPATRVTDMCALYATRLLSHSAVRDGVARGHPDQPRRWRHPKECLRANEVSDREIAAQNEGVRCMSCSTCAVVSRVCALAHHS